MTPAGTSAAVPRLTIDEQNPWPGLSAFDESAQRFFNGRREESAALRRLVTQAPLTILFGGSGLGKTSLVQAGLFPLLRKDVFPIYVRLDPRDSKAPLIEQVKASMRIEVARRRVEAPECGDGESLWAYLHRTGLEFWNDRNQLLTPLFVFDQFEEVFTLGAVNSAAIARLRVDLADLIENRIPDNLDEAGAGLSADNQRYKVLLSFREDFLPQLEGWKRDIPSIMRNRLRLLPMSGEQAFEAVHKTAPHLAPVPVARRIVAFVAAASDIEEGAELSVEPALLSLVCHGLNERRKEQGKAQFDEALLTGTGQAIVADFYRNAVSGFPPRVPRFIERELITERGFRKPCDLDDARTLHGLTDAELRTLVDRRLLRIEPARGTERVELTHDLLTRVVREDRDRERERERVQRESAGKRRLTLIGTALGCIALVMGWLYYRANREKLVAEDALRQLTEQKARADEAKQTAEDQRSDAVKSKALAQTEARAALAHQFAGAAITAVNDSQPNIGVPLALRAIEVTRDTDRVIMPDAENALRRANVGLPLELELPGHTSPITHMEFSPDGRRIATSGSDAVRIWDLSQGEQVAKFPPCALLSFSADWKRLACGNPPFGDFEDFATRKVIKHIGFRGFGLDRMGLSADGKLLFWGTRQETTVSDGSAFLKTFPGYNAVLTSDGKTIATIIGGAPEQMRLSEVATGRILRTIGTPNTPLLCIAISPDGSRLAGLYPNEARLFETASGRDVAQWPLNSQLPVACRFGPNGSTFVVESSVAANAWDLRASPPVLIRQIPVATLDSQLTMSATKEGNSASVQVYQTKTTIELPGRDTGGVRLAAFSPDSKRVLTSGNDMRARIWDVSSGRRLLTLIGHRSALASAAYSPDNNRILTGGMNGEVKLWDARTGKLLRDFRGQGNRILASAFSADSKRVAISEYQRGVFLWDLETGSELTAAHPIHPQADVFGLAFSADGKQLVLAGTEVRILDARSFKEISQIPGSIPLPANGITLSRNRDAIAAVDLNGVRIWRQGSGKWDALPGSAGGTDLQIPVAFTRDGKRIVTPGVDLTVRVWDVASGKQLTISYYDTVQAVDDDIKIKAVAFSPDERKVYAVGNNATLFQFSVSLDDLIEEAHKRIADAKVKLSDGDCAKYLHQQPCPASLSKDR